MIWRILGPLVVAAVLALISFNALLGLPGGVFMDLLLTSAATQKMGPGAWGVALVISATAPFGIPPADWARQYFWPAASWWGRIGAGLLGYLALGTAATYFFAAQSP